MDNAECVNGIVGHVVEANVGTITDALDEYTEHEEEKGEDVFCCFHELTVVDDWGRRQKAISSLCSCFYGNIL